MTPTLETTIEDTEGCASHVMLVAIMFFEFMIGVIHLISGIRLADIKAKYDMFQWRTVCFFKFTINASTFLVQWAGYVMLLTALDRLMCAYFPISYNKRCTSDNIETCSVSKLRRSLTISRAGALSSLTSHAHKHLFKVTRTVTFINGNTLLLSTLPDIVNLQVVQGVPIRIIQEQVYCSLENPHDQQENCDVQLTGTLYNDNYFNISSPKHKLSSKLVESDDDRNRTIIDITVLGSFLMMLCLFMVIFHYRQEIKFNSNVNTSGGRNTLKCRHHLYLDGTINLDDDDFSTCNTSDLNDLEKEILMKEYSAMFDEMDDNLKIDVERLRFETQIGRGHFGIVNRATYTTPDGQEVQVACKMLRTGVTGVAEFFNEGLTMEQLKHERIVQLIGIAFTECKVPIIITEYMTNGDLTMYLRDDANSPTVGHLMEFAVQIAEGMEYLHFSKFVHRDLAARNCMLNSTKKVKIADFGLARKCTEDELYSPQNERELPFRWMPIESLATDANFTYKGDVWAYGIVIWELMTRAMIPYETKNCRGVFEFLKQGRRLVMPSHCPPELYYEVMLKCWASDANDRPAFELLVRLVKNIIQNMLNEVLDSPYITIRVDEIDSAVEDFFIYRRHF